MISTSDFSLCKSTYLAEQSRYNHKTQETYIITFCVKLKISVCTLHFITFSSHGILTILLYCILIPKNILCALEDAGCMYYNL